MFGRTKQSPHRDHVKQHFHRHEQTRKRAEHKLSISKAKRHERLREKRAKPTTTITSLTTTPQPTNQAVYNQILGLLPRITSNNQEQQLKAVRDIRMCLSKEKNPPISEVLATGVLKHLIPFLSSTIKLQYETLWTLTNITSGAPEHTMAVVQTGCVPTLCKMLLSPDLAVREQAAWVLSNISGDSVQLRDMVLGHNVVSLLASSFFNDPSHSNDLIRIGTWMLSNLTRGRPHPSRQVLNSITPLLLPLLRRNDHDVIKDAVWTASYVTDASDAPLEHLLHPHFLGRLCELLGWRDHDIVLGVLRVLGNLVSGNAVVTQRVIDSSVLSLLPRHLENTLSHVRREVCWVLSNILAGTSEQISAVFQLPRVMMRIVDILNNDVVVVRKEACWCIANALQGCNVNEAEELIRSGCVEKLCESLHTNDTDLTITILKTLARLLAIGEEARSRYPSGIGRNKIVERLYNCEGVDEIEKLQEHKSEIVYEYAEKILTQYFDGEEVTMLEPSCDAGKTQYQFGVGNPQRPGVAFQF